MRSRSKVCAGSRDYPEWPRALLQSGHQVTQLRCKQGQAQTRGGLKGGLEQPR